MSAYVEVLPDAPPITTAFCGWALACPCCDWWYARKAWWAQAPESRDAVLFALTDSARQLVALA